MCKILYNIPTSHARKITFRIIHHRLEPHIEIKMPDAQMWDRDRHTQRETDIHTHRYRCYGDRYIDETERDRDRDDRDIEI